MIGFLDGVADIELILMPIHAAKRMRLSVEVEARLLIDIEIAKSEFYGDGIQRFSVL